MNYIPSLTPRQREALTLLADGVLMQDVPARMGISSRTAYGYLYDARLSLQAVNSIHAVAIAIRKGLI